jgi:hypothetical protein
MSDVHALNADRRRPRAPVPARDLPAELLAGSLVVLLMRLRQVRAVLHPLQPRRDSPEISASMYSDGTTSVELSDALRSDGRNVPLTVTDKPP